MEDNNERIENILAIILINLLKGTSLEEKAKQLNIAGFTNVEIANFLGTSSAVIATVLYRRRSSKKKK